MISVTLDHPWLDLDLGEEMQVLSWAPYRSGFVTARHILWREVRNADLTENFDAISWLENEVSTRAEQPAVAMLTSRNIRMNSLETAESGPFKVSCLATLGLTNAERIGTRLPAEKRDYGTINLALVITPGLTETAMLEALSIATQARTAAVMNAGHDLPTGRATGTGTDCIAIACPKGDTAYAGLHTDVGEAIGRATYAAIATEAKRWIETEGKE